MPLFISINNFNYFNNNQNIIEVFFGNNFDISSKIDEDYQNNLILLLPQPPIPKQNNVFFGFGIINLIL